MKSKLQKVSVLWRTIAERAYKTLKKGELIWVEGRIKTRSFEDKSGVKKRLTEIVIENFRQLGKGEDCYEVPENLQAEKQPLVLPLLSPKVGII